jgi:hypothetical protein
MSVEIKKMREAILQSTIKELNIPKRFHTACLAICESNSLDLVKIGLIDQELKDYILPFVNRHADWIEVLNISRNYNISDFGIQILVEISRLGILVAEQMHIGDLGAEAIAKIKGLRELKVSHNHIGPQGAKALGNTRLNTLEIACNRLEGAGALELSKINSLCTLIIYGNDIRNDASAQEGISVAQALANMEALKYLDISKNPIEEDEVVQALKSRERRCIQDAMPPALKDVVPIVCAYRAGSCAMATCSMHIATHDAVDMYRHKNTKHKR